MDIQCLANIYTVCTAVKAACFISTLLHNSLLVGRCGRRSLHTSWTQCPRTCTVHSPLFFFSFFFFSHSAVRTCNENVGGGNVQYICFTSCIPHQIMSVPSWSVSLPERIYFWISRQQIPISWEPVVAHSFLYSPHLDPFSCDSFSKVIILLHECIIFSNCVKMRNFLITLPVGKNIKC